MVRQVTAHREKTDHVLFQFILGCDHVPQSIIGNFSFFCPVVKCYMYIAVVFFCY